uniref:Olfactory receptor n=1 Tax=Monodelphis domestica TaxID=13616 RepID=A0A5F8GQP5_MONDO
MTGNQTIISEFLLLGLPIQPEMKVPLYTVFLAMYLITVLGNLIIIFLILVDSHLHTPMYLFLSNLSFSDMCFSSVTIPKMLINMQNKKPAISYTGCLTQMYFFFFFGDLESFLLVAMAFDRYVAICDPLHYTVIMNPKLCITFSSNNIISHFFCDLSALLKLASSDVHINELMIFIFGGLVLVVPFLLIVASYARILSSILRVPSVRGIRKAFSTCGSHLSVVSLFYGTIIGLYLCPSSNNSTVKEIVMSIMYTVVTPMLNPFIYSLRNQDIKGAIKNPCLQL